MNKTPTYADGTFIWREISTPDVAASKRCYGEVFGWNFTDMPMGEFTSTMIGAGERGVGGMTPLDPSTGAPPSWVGTNEGGLGVLKLGDKTVASITPAEGGAPSHWLTYVVVDDLAAARARVVNNGGTVLAEEHAVPGVGRFAVVTDNVGAVICPFQPAG